MSSISLTLGLRGRLLSGTQTTLQGALFGNGEPGFTFEPWDITTLYQDRAGTTPVTAAGQSVGLRLSKDQGLRIGPELVTNGDFSTDTNWTKGSGCTISGGKAVMTAATGFFRQSLPSLTVGMYEFTVIVDSVSSGTVAVELGGAVGNDFNITSSGTYVFRRYWGGVDPTIYVNSKSDPVTAVIDSVSLKLVSGNHEVAVSDAKRGVYGWLPKTGRRNLLTYTEQFDNAAWVKGTGGSISSNSAIAPDGTMTAHTYTWATSSPSFAYLSQQAVGVSQNPNVYSVWLKRPSGTGSRTVKLAVTDLTVSTATSGTFTVTEVWQRFEFTRTSASTTGFVGAGLFAGTSGSPIAAGELLEVWHPQLEVGSTATAYQRVASRYDITEAGVPTCYYVQADGVDDAYVTPTITPNTDKVQVFAGIRKLSDAALGVVAELSVGITANTGSFCVFAPVTVGNTYAFGSRGSAVQNFAVGSGFAAPTTNVLTGIGDIAADNITLRINSTQVAQNTADQGTGNYLAYPAYIYGRAGTSLPFNGLDFGHAVRFGPNLDAATIARVEALIARNTPEVTL